VVRYKELRQILAGEIASGTYAVGDRFPTEHELCARFEVSRHTVREALRALEDQGLLARQAGSGTTVLARTPHAHYTQTLDSLTGLFDYAADTVFESRHEGYLTAREGLAQTLGCAAGTRWLRFAGIRRVAPDGVAVCWTEIFVAEAYGAVREDLTAGGEPLYALIQKRFSLEISAVEQRVSALAMTAEMAKALDVEPLSPALLTRRRYFADSAESFEISLSFHPASRYAFTQRLRRAEQGTIRA